MLKKAFKNIKTTLFGAFAGLPQIVLGIKTGDFILVFTGASTLLMGLFSKDIDKNEQN